MFIQTESTPNPDALKFLPSRAVMAEGTLDMRTVMDAVASPLAQQLFDVHGVEGVFFAPDFIAITKSPALDWQVVKPHVQARIMDFYLSGQPLLIQDNAANNDRGNISADKLADPIVQQILAVIDEHIRPGVARDGGDVKFVDFDEGVLGNVVRVIVVDHHFSDVPVHPLLVLAHKQIEPVISGLRIADF